MFQGAVGGAGTQEYVGSQTKYLSNTKQLLEMHGLMQPLSFPPVAYNATPFSITHNPELICQTDVSLLLAALSYLNLCI